MGGRVKVHAGVIADSKYDALPHEAGNPKTKNHVSLGERGSPNRSRDLSGKHIWQPPCPPHLPTPWADLADSPTLNCVSVCSGQVSTFCGEGSVRHRMWSLGKGECFCKPSSSLVLHQAASCGKVSWGRLRWSCVSFLTDSNYSPLKSS